MEQQNKDAPAVMRRRRKVARQQREQTPDATKLEGVKCSDEDSSSNTEHSTKSISNVEQKVEEKIEPKVEQKIEQNQSKPYLPPRTLIPSQQAQIQPQRSVPPKSDKRKNDSPSMGKAIGGHLSKILSRRDKKLSTANVRSLSSPREENVTGRSDVFALMRQARRSLSSPRNKEDSSDSGRASPAPPARKERNNSLTKAIHTNGDASNNKAMTTFERNIQRFDEERRRFEIEKKRFEYEKRELDLIRKRRMEEFNKKRLLNSITLSRPIDGLQHFQLPPSNEEEKQKLIQSFEEAQKMSSSLPKKNSLSSLQSKRSDYESSTCDSSDVSEEEDDLSSSPQSDQITSYTIDKKSDSELSDKAEVTATITLKKILPLTEETITVVSELIMPEIKLSDELIIADVIDHEKVKIEEVEKIATICEEKLNGTVKEVAVASVVDKIEKKKISPKEEVIQNGKKKPSFTRSAFSDTKIIWKQFRKDHPQEWQTIRLLWNKCFSDLVIITIYCGLGGMVFRFTEGAFENIYKCGVKRVKRDFVDQLWLSSHNMRFI